MDRCGAQRKAIKAFWLITGRNYWGWWPCGKVSASDWNQQSPDVYSELIDRMED